MVAAVVHALALEAFYPTAPEQSCLKLSMTVTAPEWSMAVPDASAAVLQMADAHQSWIDRLPQDATGLWDWCLEQPQDVLLALLAHIGALSVDAIRQKADRPGHGRFAGADRLALAIGFDLADHYTPDGPTYFSRISSAQIVSAMCEAKGVPAAPAWSRMKKAELVALATREIAGTRWLPEVLRPQGVSVLDEAA
jgi:ParB family chromosome partitioning protein